MKFLVLLIVVVLVLGWARTMRKPRVPNPKPDVPPTAKAPAQEPMVACTHCGIHVPLGEALQSPGGTFCSAAHRAAFDRDHPKA